MYASVSVDGFVADENDQPGPLFDWLLSGDVPLDESGELKVSQASYDYTRPYWDQIGATIVGRHVFDMTNGWDGKPPGGVDHVVVMTHRPEPEGWDPEAPFHFVDGVEAAMAKAQDLAGDRIVEVAAGDVGGQMLAAGLVDEVRMDVVPVVFGAGKRCFGSVHAQHLLEDPDVVIQGNRVLHLAIGCAVHRSEQVIWHWPSMAQRPALDVETRATREGRARSVRLELLGRVDVAAEGRPIASGGELGLARPRRGIVAGDQRGP